MSTTGALVSLAVQSLGGHARSLRKQIGKLTNQEEGINTPFNDLGLEVLEDRCVPNAGPLPIDFAGANFQPYGGLDNQFNPARVQDRSGTPTVPPAGSSVTLSGNMWKALTIPAPLSAGGNYTITPRTILSFNFSSNGLGEIQASGSIIRRAK